MVRPALVDIAVTAELRNCATTNGNLVLPIASGHSLAILLAIGTILERCDKPLLVLWCSSEVEVLLKMAKLSQGRMLQTANDANGLRSIFYPYKTLTPYVGGCPPSKMASAWVPP